ncbi:hypothetical protein Q9L58_006418 [Maublancomyces gigas]|uniref:FAD/NAD(P)-binding domain-containing protein n=1 Tax=Discina gigas TaxID=1032678 RepID=A0ABR3GFC0_9PEZI
MPRVIVIGAGISGLAFTKTYLQLSNYYTSFSLPKPVDKLAPPTDKSSIPKSFTSSLSLSNPLIPTETHDIIIVDENLSLGGSWCRSRIYPNLYTQNALGTYEFSDMPLEGEGVANEAGYIAGWKLEEYLARWSEKWELTEKMRFGIKVNTICRDPTTHEWILDTNRNPPPEHLSGISEDVGRQLRLYCDKLVLAVGTSSEPNKPYIPGQEFIDDGDMVHSVELGD